MNTYIEKSDIPNTLIETMFFRIATDENMSIYNKYIAAGNIGLATAYASKMVYIKFIELLKYE